MDKREALKSMITNLINDRSEEASLDFHSYLTDKMRDISGVAAADTTQVETPDVAEVQDAPSGEDE